MNKKRVAGQPALILLNDVRNVPEVNYIDGPEYLIGRCEQANLTILQQYVSRKHCFLKHDAKTDQWSLTSLSRKAVSVRDKDVKADDEIVLECGDKIKISSLLVFEFKCSPNTDLKCCQDFKRMKLSDSSNEEKKMENILNNTTNVLNNAVVSNHIIESPASPEMQATLPISQIPDSADFNDIKDKEILNKPDSPSLFDFSYPNYINGSDTTIDHVTEPNVDDLEIAIKKYLDSFTSGVIGQFRNDEYTLQQKLENEFSYRLIFLRKLDEFNSFCDSHFSESNHGDIVTKIKNVTSFFQNDYSLLTHLSELIPSGKQDQHLSHIILNLDASLMNKTKSIMQFMHKFFDTSFKDEDLDIRSTSNISSVNMSENKFNRSCDENDSKKMPRRENDLEAEIQKYKDNIKRQEARIQLLEMELKGKENLEEELATLKMECESKETEFAKMKTKSDKMEILELENKCLMEREKYREEDKRTKDGLELTINKLVDQVEELKKENRQLAAEKTKVLGKVKVTNQKLEKLHEKIDMSLEKFPGSTVGLKNSTQMLSYLSIFPFEILRNLFESASTTAEYGVTLRRWAFDHGAIHILLECLAIFTHESDTIDLSNLRGEQQKLVAAMKQCYSSRNNEKSEAESHQYWAKGTGFSTGSTEENWNVEQYLCKQRFEEEHVVVLLQVLSYYVNPDSKLQHEPSVVLEELSFLEEAEPNQSMLPSMFVELLKRSCLLPVLISYLRNESVLDLERHIPLYKAIMVLLRAMALDSQLVNFLLPPEYCASTSASTSAESTGKQISLIELLNKMRICVDTYSSTLKKNEPVDKGESSFRDLMIRASEEESRKSLATLIADILATARIVELITDKIISKTNPCLESLSLQKTLTAVSIKEVYLKIMKEMQFDTYDMISEEGNGYKFNVAYHFESTLRSNEGKNHPSRMRRLAQEAVTLSTSLPISYSSSVFVKCDTDRLGVMKVLMTGPAETPYANGCFEFDVYFPPDYPNSPMLINLETNGQKNVRFNPNLYEDGKVCLSVLNTWSGRPEERWNAQTSSFLQVLVSIQSLILVPDPYFNEPGYEKSRGTASGNQSSRKYNANIRSATVQWAMLNQIRNPSPCFGEIIHTHFWLKRNEITEQIISWINEDETKIGNKRKINRNMPQCTESLRDHFKVLCDEFAKLTPPEGLKEMVDLNLEYKTPTMVLEPVASTSTVSARRRGKPAAAKSKK